MADSGRAVRVMSYGRSGEATQPCNVGLDVSWEIPGRWAAGNGRIVGRCPQGDLAGPRFFLPINFGLGVSSRLSGFCHPCGLPCGI